MAPIEKPKDKEVSSITLPPDTVQALRELQGSLTSQNLAQLKNDVESRNLASKMKTVFAQLDSLKGEHPELEDSIEDIKAYLILLQHNQKPEVKDATDVAFEFTRSYQSRHVRTASVGEPKTAGGINIPVPTTTFTGTDAAGNVVVDYGRPIEHGDLLSNPEFLASAERGKGYLRTIAIGSTDGTKGNSGITSSEDTSVKEIEETLKEINPETLDKAVTLSEKFINLVPDAQTKATLQGVHGAIILNMLRQAGHNLTIRDGKVEIQPKPGVSVVELQTKLQTLVNTGRLSIDTLKTGLLYSSPIFKKYATELGVTKDAQGNIVGIDPKASSKTFLEHVADLKKAGQNSPDITSLLASAGMLESVNFNQAMKGFQDLGQVSAFVEKNPGLLASVGAHVNTSTQHHSSEGSKETNTTITGSIAQDGVTGGKITSSLSLAGKGFTQGFSDIMRLGKGDPIAMLGIGGFLFYAIYKMFHLGAEGKFSFLRGLTAVLGLGAINNWEKIGDNLSGLGDAAKKVATKVEGAAQALQEATGDKLQQWFESRFSASNIDQTTIDKKIAGKNVLLTQNGKTLVDSYQGHLNYLKSDALLSTLRAKDLLLGDPSKSLWSNEASLYAATPANIDSALLKSMLRHVILGEDSVPSVLNGSLIDMRANKSSIPMDKLNSWLQKNNLTENDLQTMTVKDLLKKIHA
ncbi:MAG: hypothetical protein U0518_00940 [Candidatus Gracilibacteria bacterium]